VMLLIWGRRQVHFWKIEQPFDATSWHDGQFTYDAHAFCQASSRSAHRSDVENFNESARRAHRAGSPNAPRKLCDILAESSIRPSAKKRSLGRGNRCARVTGGPPERVCATAGVPQMAADLLHRQISAALGQKQKLIRRKGPFTGTSMSPDEPPRDSRKSFPTLLLSVNGKVENAQNGSRCVPDLLLHRGSCHCCSSPGACCLSYVEIHRVQLDRGTAKLHLWRWLGRSLDLARSQSANTVL
jgi:hypothetical protein